MERFYLLCPATGYAGEYIWQGDAVSGALEILKHNNIPADEWQMGTSKVFIRHPETVKFSLTGRRRMEALTRFRVLYTYRSLRLKTCATSTGTIWLRVSSELGVPMFDINMNVRGKFSGSGDKTSTILATFRCVNMVISSWTVARSVAGSRF